MIRQLAISTSLKPQQMLWMQHRNMLRATAMARVDGFAFRSMKRHCSSFADTSTPAATRNNNHQYLQSPPQSPPTLHTHHPNDQARPKASQAGLGPSEYDYVSPNKRAMSSKEAARGSQERCRRFWRRITNISLGKGHVCVECSAQSPPRGRREQLHPGDHR